MPPSGRTRYPHAFSSTPVGEVNPGSRRGSRAEPPPPWTYPGGVIPETAAAFLLHDKPAWLRCHGCGRHVPLDLRALVEAGRGQQWFYAIRFVCAACGSRSCAVEAGEGTAPGVARS